MTAGKNHYRQTDILTASQKKLIVILYQTCIKNINQAIASFPPRSGKAIANIHRHLVAAQDILTELMATLDFENGGHIAENLYQLYQYFYSKLTEANLKKDNSALPTIRDQLASLCEAWQEIDDTKVKANPAPSNGLNLQG